MKKLFYITFIALTLVSVTVSCDDENTWEDYQEWRKLNDEWLTQQKSLKNPDGTPFYNSLVPSWYPMSGVLIHYFNDRSQTEGNLQPLLTSTVDVKYIGRLYDDEAFDSSYTNTINGDSIFRFQPSGTIVGWQIAITDMRVGDSARIIVPFMEGYGAVKTGSIPPYSNLVFDVKLVDIYKYELQ